MGSIAVQTAASNATTELSDSFASMVDTGEFQYGCNSEGIFLLNSDEAGSTRTFTLATTDFGMKNHKRLRKLYIGLVADSPITVSVMGDKKVWRHKTKALKKTGLQTLRVPIDRDGFGRYWTIKISATTRFRIDSIDGLLVVRSLGIRGM